MKRTQQVALLLAILSTGFCGMVAEYSISTAVAYLVGNSVAAFSVVISTFMIAMGIGGLWSQRVEGHELSRFLTIEVILSLVSALSVTLISQAMRVNLQWEAALLSAGLIGLLIGFEIPLLMRVNEQHEIVLKKNVAVVFGADYLGSFIAGALFSPLLLPRIGIVNVPILSGAINLAVVVLLIAAFWESAPVRRHVAAVLASVVALGGLLAVAESVVFDAEQAAYKDRIIYAEQTSYQKILLTERRDNLCLFLNGHTQFCTVDEFRYHESLVHPAFALNEDAAKVLVLGGGDGMTVRDVLRHPSVTAITMVELDPGMVEISRSHSSLVAANKGAFQSPRLHVEFADAMTWVRDDRQTWDVVIIDLPDPSTPETAKLYSLEFYRSVAERLAEDGVVATHATSPLHAREAFVTIIETLRAAGLVVVPYRTNVPSFGDWGFAVAMHAEWTTEDRMRAHLERYEPPARLETRYLNNDAMRASMLWERGMWKDRATLTPSGLARPAVLDRYRKAMGRMN